MLLDQDGVSLMRQVQANFCVRLIGQYPALLSARHWTSTMIYTI